MKIGIITHHNVHNHGAVLQLNALIKVLESMGHTASVLSYTKNYDFLEKNATNKYNISLRSIPYYINYLVKNGLSKTSFNIKKKSILGNFRTDNQLVNGYYSKEKDLDCVFIGSDEVFSIEVGLNTFFWGMGVPCKNVFSYAASFGPTNINFIKEKYAEEFVVAGINRFKEISVRDRNSQDIILKLSGKKVPIVCDPVILYGYEKEVNKLEKPINDNYMLVYSYDKNMNDNKEFEQIIKYARSQNLKVISAGFYHKWCDKNINITPIELVNYIKHAECVITDTFHGTVISIVMNSQFVTKIRGNNNKLGFLLEEYDLLNRRTEDFTDLRAQFEVKIDFKQVGKVVEEKRIEAKKYIRTCLEGITYE